MPPTEPSAARAPLTTRDPRLDAVVAGVALVLVLGGLARAIAEHAGFVAAHPRNLAWIALSLAVGVAGFFLNGEGVALRGRALAWAGYGTFALVAGFSLQGLVNGSILRALPAGSRGVLAYLVLGVGAGVCQTAGKWLMITVLNRVHRPQRRVDVLAVGLAVGLGFGLTEVVFIGSRLIDAQTAVVGLGLIGVWERASAVFFHVYSAGLVATGIASRRSTPIVAVVAIHSFDDWLAGGVHAGAFAIPVLLLESTFTAAALLVWALFRLSARALPPASEVTRAGAAPAPGTAPPSA